MLMMPIWQEELSISTQAVRCTRARGRKRARARSFHRFEHGRMKDLEEHGYGSRALAGDKLHTGLRLLVLGEPPPSTAL